MHLPNPEQTAVAVCESAPGHPPSADTKALVLSLLWCTAAQAQEAPASTFGAYGEQSDHKTLQSESPTQRGSRNSSQRPSLHTAAVGLAEIQKLVPHILGSSSFDTSVRTAKQLQLTHTMWQSVSAPHDWNCSTCSTGICELAPASAVVLAPLPAVPPVASAPPVVPPEAVLPPVAVVPPVAVLPAEAVVPPRAVVPPAPVVPGEAAPPVAMVPPVPALPPVSMIWLVCVSPPAPAAPVPPLATPPVLTEPPPAPPTGEPLLPQPKIMGSAKKATTDERRSQVDLFSMGLLDLQHPGQRGGLPVFRGRSAARALKLPRSATVSMRFGRV